ncbi:MAG: restriction endonuclease, SacI family [Limisphaerales bacterium]
MDLLQAARLLEAHWQAVTTEAALQPDLNYVEEADLPRRIHNAVNHKLVAYRFCLPIQLLGKVTKPSLDCLKLQRGDGSDPTAWDARSLGSKVVCEFNRKQESVLGTSQDPYVGKPMRQPRMFRDDRSKKDVAGWNMLVDILEGVERRNSRTFAVKIFRQVLLEIYRRQQTLCFYYPIPPRISLEATLGAAAEFLAEKSGGDRALALTGALFNAIGVHFGLFAQVHRARINASDEATGQAADLECVDPAGRLVFAVEVKDRMLTLADVEGTLQKSRRREIKDIFFTAGGLRTEDRDAVGDRIARAFAAGQNLYIFDFFEIARGVLALGGEPIRQTFLKNVGENLDTWNTQPRHRQAWKNLLERL